MSEDRSKVGHRAAHRTRLRLILALGFLLCLAAVALTNPSGFCSAKGRHLADKEYIIAGIEEIVKSSQHFSAPIRAYRSISEFQEINPSCCQLLRFGGTIAVSQLGFSVEVNVKYRDRSDTPALTQESWIELDACGRRLGKILSMTM